MVYLFGHSSIVDNIGKGRVIAQMETRSSGQSLKKLNLSSYTSVIISSILQVLCLKKKKHL